MHGIIVTVTGCWNRNGSWRHWFVSKLDGKVLNIHIRRSLSTTARLPNAIARFRHIRIVSSATVFNATFLISYYRHHKRPHARIAYTVIYWALMHFNVDFVVFTYFVLVLLRSWSAEAPSPSIA